MVLLIRKLRHTRLLTIAGSWFLLQAVLTGGVNLMVLLRIAAKLHPNRIAIADDREQLSYVQLWEQAESLSTVLHMEYGLCSHQKIAVISRNHASAIKAVFAVSRLGAHLFLLNPEMSADQVKALQARLQFDFVIYDQEVTAVVQNSPLRDRSLPTYHPTERSIARLSSSPYSRNERLGRTATGAIVVMTGGTTGQPKSASRKPSVLNYLPPFMALLTQANLEQYQSVYIATPICHGYGLAFLIIGIILGAKIYLLERFDAARACTLVDTHKIEAMIVVPLILQRMLRKDPGSLSSLKCIVTGSALLSPALARATLDQLGPKLFNLYGSSEAGFCVIATPDILCRKPESIGKPVTGVRVKIVDGNGHEVEEKTIGQLCIRSAWTSSGKRWIETGDLVYRDSEGDLFLCGRADDMVVSGGENVFPIELENVLTQHPDVDDAAVFGIADEEFGQRLKAVVIRKPSATLDQPALLDWLKPRVARYQMPAVIEFRDELPHTSIGKLDRKALRR